ncbi:hypothetical protein BWI93_13105 [Siphonobacter sp. BAB-5385]|uniref:DUF4249 family protein n=1 Tax=Siphonobacter sp. BAB-5385 TaxID=1864822 RepID=UPI000B9E92C0|nr:DUF4249 family protein [Siphonobacter sp. BAB-5385]OZI07722.1 hypothetical protein BWI93_13105 [Siphonobacter sp. BAB-5385]
MRTTLFFIFLLLINIACTKILEIPGPIFKPKPVLVGVLHPDSSLSVRLFMSREAKDTSGYKPITSSTVTFSEDNIALGKAVHAGDGFYVLTVEPKEGHTYKVQAEIPTYGIVEAEDFLPAFPSYTVTVGDRNSLNANSNPDITLQFKKTDKAYYWIGINATKLSHRAPQECRNIISTGGALNSECKKYLEKESNYVSSRSAVFDMFNGSFDELHSYYSFSSLARLLPEFVKDYQQPEVTFSLTNQGGSWTSPSSAEENVLELTVAGLAFDQYLKTSLFSLENQLVDSQGKLQNPFAEPTSASSNVKNGLGIFGARNGKYILLKLNSTSSKN